MAAAGQAGRQVNAGRLADVRRRGAATGPCANAAATIRHAAQVSVADAHIGAVVQSAPADRISVLTGDPADMRRIAGDRNVTVVTI
jgi:hypothetical protein